jgi:hypothetical protein
MIMYLKIKSSKKHKYRVWLRLKLKWWSSTPFLSLP